MRLSRLWVNHFVRRFVYLKIERVVCVFSTGVSEPMQASVTKA